MGLKVITPHSSMSSSSCCQKTRKKERRERKKEIGLTHEQIEARINQSLRKAGITPAATNKKTTECAVYVNVNVTGDSFTIDVSFMRPVYYRSGDKCFRTTAITWTRGGTGYTRRKDKDYVLDAITENVEAFANEFLKANKK
jgi:hypothetical protein